MLTQTDSLVTIGAAIVVHLIYNKREPRELYTHFGLLVVIPCLLVAILHRSFSTILSAFSQIYPIFLLALSTSVVLYRLSPFHPLAKFPGPLVNRISNLWLSYKATDGKRYLYFKRLHDQYGPYVRIGPNNISVADANTILPIFGAKGLPRGPMYKAALSDAPSIVNETDAFRHAKKRKIWNRGFTPNALKGYDEIIFRRTIQLVERLGQQTGSVDLGKWIGYFNFDFMGDLTFGGGFEMMKEGGDPEGLWSIITDGMRTLGVLYHIPWIAQFLAILPMAEGVSRLMNFAQERVNIRSRTGAIAHDLFHHIAVETEADERTGVRYQPSLKDIVTDTAAAIVAGSDTTAATMTLVFYFLMLNPTVKSRLVEEVDSFFERDEEVRDLGKLAAMPYLNACINEALRVLPPNTTMLQRTPEKGSGGAWIGNMFIPEGTAVFVPPYVLHHDPRYFSPSPDHFWPERWLIEEGPTRPDKEKEPTPDFVHNTTAFIPFSFGPANCIGKYLAYREMQVVIVSIIQKYDFAFEKRYRPEQFLEDLRDDLVLVKGKLPVVLSKRT